MENRRGITGSVCEVTEPLFWLEVAQHQQEARRIFEEAGIDGWAIEGIAGHWAQQGIITSR
eukprot:5237447-Lingulodinium_polyedra.AAC.1